MRSVDGDMMASFLQAHGRVDNQALSTSYPKVRMDEEDPFVWRHSRE